MMSTEALCRHALAILNAHLRDEDTVRQLRELFDTPAPDPRPVELNARLWPVLSGSGVVPLPDSGGAWERHDDPHAD